MRKENKDRFLADLNKILAPKDILLGADVSARSSGVWGNPPPHRAFALVTPRNTEQVASIMRLCGRYNQPVVVHGGLSGVVQATVTELTDLAMSTDRLNKIENIDPTGGTMTVQAGVTLQKVQEAAAKHSLMFPLDLGARGSATIGGNAATNAGGVQVLRYGMARNLILGLEAVTPTGEIISDLTKVVKDNSGYDLKQIFIGAEGTLGVITRLVLRLFPQPAGVSTVLAGLNAFHQLPEFLNFLERELPGRVIAFEVMWRNYWRFMIRQLNVGAPPLGEDYAFYTLVEFTQSRYDNPEMLERVLNDAISQGKIENAVISQSERERENLWRLRESVEQLHALKPLFLYDVSLPIAFMEEYVNILDRRLSRSYDRHQLLTFGHLGDGNLHLCISAEGASQKDKPKIDELVYEGLYQYAGSISAEHGIGLEKLDALATFKQHSQLELMRRLKSSLDPQNILNPGRVIPLA